MNKLLTGINILITRPAHQSQSLIDLIQQHGGHCIEFPTLAIQPPTDYFAMQHAIKHLAQFDYAIFTSANAVFHSSATLHHYWPTLPSTLKIVAVGDGTKRTLLEANIPVHHVPKIFNSEGILDLPEFHRIKDCSIAVFSGEGGRPLLIDTLLQRGAKVEKIICYQRIMPKITKQQVADLLLIWEKLPIHLVVMTSNESLENLFAMLGTSGQTILMHTAILGISERLKEKALQLGLKQIVTAKNASDEAIVAALLKWRKSFL